MSSLIKDLISKTAFLILVKELISFMVLFTKTAKGLTVPLFSVPYKYSFVRVKLELCVKNMVPSHNISISQIEIYSRTIFEVFGILIRWILSRTRI